MLSNEASSETVCGRISLISRTMMVGLILASSLWSQATLLHSEDFSAPYSYPYVNWNANPTNGVLHMTVPGALLKTTDPLWGNYLATFELTPEFNTSELRFGFRHFDVSVPTRGLGYELRVGPPLVGGIQLRKNVSSGPGAWTQMTLASNAYTVTGGVTYFVTVECIGQEISITVDDRMGNLGSLTYWDPAPYLKGGVYLWKPANTSTCVVDNLRIWGASPVTLLTVGQSPQDPSDTRVQLVSPAPAGSLVFVFLGDRLGGGASLGPFGSTYLDLSNGSGGTPVVALSDPLGFFGLGSVSSTTTVDAYGEWSFDFPSLLLPLIYPNSAAQPVFVESLLLNPLALPGQGLFWHNLTQI